jgi:hypothetical protein
MHLSGVLQALRLPASRQTLPTLCVAAIIGCALAAAGLLLLDRWEVSRNAEREASNVASIVAQDIGHTIAGYDLSLQAVVHGLDMPGVGDLDPNLRQMVVFDRATAASQFGFLDVLNEAGDVVAESQARMPRAANFASRDYFRTLRRDPREQLFVGRPFLTAPGQPAMIPLARRRSHPDGSFAGVVVGSMRLAYVQTILGRPDLGERGSIALLRTRQCAAVSCFGRRDSRD